MSVISRPIKRGPGAYIMSAALGKVCGYRTRSPASDLRGWGALTRERGSKEVGYVVSVG